MPLGRLRITYTGGLSPLGSDRGDRRARPSSSRSARPRRRPDTTAVITVPWTRNERGALTGLKTTSYAENVVALARAREQGASEALFANTVGRLCEGTGSNVFVVLDGEHPHPAGRLRLPRGHHPRPGRRVDRRPRRPTCRWTCWTEADEIFLTSTLRDVQAVHRVDDRELRRHARAR